MITRDQLYVGRPVKFKGDMCYYQGFIVRIELPMFWCSRQLSDEGYCRYNIDLEGTTYNSRYDYPPSWVSPIILKTSLVKE